MHIYLTIMAVLAGFALLMSIKHMGTLFLMFSFGLATPLVYSATLFLYGLALSPYIINREKRHKNKAFSIGQSVIWAGAFATIPGLLSFWHGHDLMDRLARQDMQPAQPVAARSLEIHRANRYHDKTFSGRRHCSYVCQILLVSGQVKWIRVIAWEGNQDTSVTFYVAKKGADCEFDDKGPEAHKSCIVLTQDNGAPADLLVKFKTEPNRKLIQSARERISEWRTVTAYWQQGEEKNIVLRQTESKIKTILIPTMIGPTFIGIHSKGIDLQRYHSWYNKITARKVFANLGFRVDDAIMAESNRAKPKLRKWTDGINDVMTREMVAVLDLPKKDVFNREESRMLSDWIFHARAIKDWDQEKIVLLRRIVRDRRLRQPTFAHQIIVRNLKLAKQLLPDIIDMIEADGIGRDYTIARKVAYDLPKLPLELLKPHAGRITALLQNGGQIRETLLRSAGRLGGNPVSHLLPLRNDLTSKEPYPRLRGACHAEKKWWSVLISPLRQALAESQGAHPGIRSWKIQSYRKNILRTLFKLGDGAFVKEQISTGRYKDADRLLSEFEYYMKNKSESWYNDRICRF